MRSRDSHQLFGLGCHAALGAAAALACLFSPDSASAQSHPVFAQVTAAALDSGIRRNDAADPAVVFSEVVFIPNSPWLRLVFDAVELEGDSQLVLTSLADGDKQVFNKQSITEWQHTSAFFNGGAIQIDLVAAGKTTSNRVAMTRAIAGTAQQPPVNRAVCESIDQRTVTPPACSRSLCPSPPAQAACRATPRSRSQDARAS